MNEKIQELEKQISIIKETLKDSVLSSAEKQDLWSEQEKLEDKLNNLLVESGVEIQPWEW
jgi:regulator of replication initiation timing